MKTTWINKSDIQRKWYLVDVAGHILGRSATEIAKLLMGKGKVDRVPNMDCGDYVIVVNAAKVKVTGKKLTDKLYYRHSGYPGGLKSEALGDRLARKPEEVIRSAVKNMLPNTKLRDTMLPRLMIYAGSEHGHEAQKPVTIELTS